MSKINVLSFEVANLIAAGEVVDRPASVLKELLENSIDSGATSVTAEIKRGGVALIRVCDNGSGIDSSDIPLAIKRHATSKISKAEDLDSIFTLGFRGEALAAISSVSKMSIITKTAEAETATMLVSEFGNVTEICEVGAKEGTTVLVETLFANVPARRKFLKKDITEAMAALAVAERIALSHPSIAFTFISDGNVKFSTQGDGNLLNTIYAIYGRDFAGKLLSCDGEATGISVSGYIGRSDNVRNSRNMQNFFINGRYVKSKTVMAALEQAFTSFIAPEKFPVCVLFINIDANKVDVNVHPAKLEVKFSDERAIFEAVYYTVRSAISRGEYRAEIELPQKKQSAVEKLTKADFKSSAEQIPFSTDTLKKSFDNQQNVKKTDYSIQTNSPSFEEKTTSPHKNLYNGSQSNSQNIRQNIRIEENKETCDVKTSLELLNAYREAKSSTKSPSVLRSPDWADLAFGASGDKSEKEIHNSDGALLSDASENISSVNSEKKAYRIIGEAFLCYVLVEYGDKLLLIDKHAAHERILFEQLKRQCEKDVRVSSQPLMLPIEVDLDTMTCAALKEHKGEMEIIGFEFEIGERKATIYAIPYSIDVNEASDFFSENAEKLLAKSGNPELWISLEREKSLYQIACKAAIKGGRSYDSAHIEWLVSKVMELPDITVCPHGRPIAMEISKNQLDRNFDRLK